MPTIGWGRPVIGNSGSMTPRFVCILYYKAIIPRGTALHNGQTSNNIVSIYCAVCIINADSKQASDEGTQTLANHCVFCYARRRSITFEVEMIGAHSLYRASCRHHIATYRRC